MTDEILSPLGSLTSSSVSCGIPGSVILIRGVGFTKRQTALDENSQLRVVDAAPDGLWIQLPWEYASSSPGIHKVVIRSGNNPFEAAVNINVTRAIEPQIATWKDPSTGLANAKAVHQDYTSLVTPTSPARPGEIVHVYLTGFGPAGPATSDWRARSYIATPPSTHAALLRIWKPDVAAAANDRSILCPRSGWDFPSRPDRSRQHPARINATLWRNARTAGKLRAHEHSVRDSASMKTRSN